ncbi:FAD binding domain-containing protein [Tepidamorphus sp. 3E244]|uniref:FAD binding domain-containing protein n=1 Tax=Tepidamorphus sp. 3E244 TaxID=3385498 RepID=UPI0038FCFB34
MKAPWFDYHAPTSLDEALTILKDADFDGRVLAGGQSLMPMLNMRIADPAVLVDINRLPGLNAIEEDGDTLKVGALVRHADLLSSDVIRQRWPLLHEATTQVAHPAIRNRGTVCGSVAHNDPAAEHPSILATYDGTVLIASKDGEREVPADEFSLGMLTTDLESGEMVVGLRYKRPPEGTSTAFVEFARRLGDFAIAGAAAMLTVNNGVCARARVTIVGMGDGPVRAVEAEELLTGKDLTNGTADLFAEVAETVSANVEASEDVHSSTGYRRHLAGVVARRALAKAHERAGGGQ